MNIFKALIGACLSFFLLAIGFCISAIWSLNPTFSQQCQSMSTLFFILGFVAGVVSLFAHEDF